MFMILARPTFKAGDPEDSQGSAAGDCVCNGALGEKKKVYKIHTFFSSFFSFCVIANVL
jgi:hypothetical protein